MNYNLTDFMIKSANRIIGKEDENEYLIATAYNPMNRFEKTHKIITFNRVTIEYYKTQLPISRGGLLPDEGWDESKMKTNDKRFLNGCTVEYDLGGLYCRKYTADIVDTNGNVIPGKSEGEYIRDANGNIAVFSKILIFCQYCFKTETIIDENGLPILDPNTGNPKVKTVRDADGKPIEQWVSGWSPIEVGEKMRRLLVRYDEPPRTGRTYCLVSSKYDNEVGTFVDTWYEDSLYDLSKKADLENLAIACVNLLAQGYKISLKAFNTRNNYAIELPQAKQQSIGIIEAPKIFE